MCGWDQVTIEALLPQEKNLSSLLYNSLSDLILTTYPFEGILKTRIIMVFIMHKIS